MKKDINHENITFYSVEDVLLRNLFLNKHQELYYVEGGFF